MSKPILGVALQQNPGHEIRFCSLQISVKTNTEPTATSTKPFYKTPSAAGFSLHSVFNRFAHPFRKILFWCDSVKTSGQSTASDDIHELLSLPEGKIPGPQVTFRQVR